MKIVTWKYNGMTTTAGLTEREIYFLRINPLVKILEII